MVCGKPFTTREFYSMCVYGNISADVPHIQQESSWDCGVACLQMVLTWSRISDCDTVSSLLELKSHNDWSKPLWTIDIFCFLMESGVDATFYTRCLGTGAHHQSIDWYTKNMGDDDVRVQELFDKATSNCWPIEKRQLGVDEVARRLDGSTVAIVLVDANILNSSASISSEGYSGHYVVLYGYNSFTGLFTCLDPARACGVRWVSSAQLDAARCHVGTDEDIVFCRRRPLL